MSACVKKTGIPKIRIYPKWSHTNEGLDRGNKNLPRSCFYREHRREKPVHSSDMYPRELFNWKERRSVQICCSSLLASWYALGRSLPRKWCCSRRGFPKCLERGGGGKLLGLWWGLETQSIKLPTRRGVQWWLPKERNNTKKKSGRECVRWIWLWYGHALCRWYSISNKCKSE